MAPSQEQLTRIIDKLVHDVEMSVHALYRGAVRQQTARVKTEGHRKEAMAALAALTGGGASQMSTGPQGGALGALSQEDVQAITRCIMAWLPMGNPAAATPDSRCIPAGRELAPTWNDRERAHAAMKRATS